MAPLKGSPFCFCHAPTAAARRAKARRRGGQRTRIGYATAPAAVATVADLQGHIGQALADVQRLENSTKRSATVARLVETARRLIEVGSLEERITALEQRMKGRR